MVAKAGRFPPLEELNAYFQARPSFQITNLETRGHQFWYQNDTTGVYCDFSYSPDEADDEISRFGASGLTFNLNYIRPSFFAYETMPLVQNFCEHFNLLVEDVQEETVHDRNARQLIESWRLHNESAVAALSQEKDVEMRYLPEERATEWWRYASVKQKLEESLTEDIFVLTIMILESPDKRLFTMIVWTRGIAQFFPRCYYVHVQRDRKRLFGTKEEAGLVPFDEVIEGIGSYLDEYDRDNGSVKYLMPDKMPDVVSAIQNFALTPIDLSKHTQVAADGFHDVALT